MSFASVVFLPYFLFFIPNEIRFFVFFTYADTRKCGCPHTGFFALFRHPNFVVCTSGHAFFLFDYKSSPLIIFTKKFLTSKKQLTFIFYDVIIILLEYGGIVSVG